MVQVFGWVVKVFVVVVSVFYIWFDIAHRNIPQLIVWCIVLASYLVAVIVKARRVRRGRLRTLGKADDQDKGTETQAPR